MGAVKEAMSEAINSVFREYEVDIHGESVLANCEVFDNIMFQLDGFDQGLRDQEVRFFDDYQIDTADFLADWLNRLSACIAVYTGVATTDDGSIGVSFDMAAYSYHYAPRQVAKALRKLGLADTATQGIIYLLAGRLLEANGELSIVKFDYIPR